MMNGNVENLLKDLQKRGKELDCLYRLEELLHNTGLSLDSIFEAIVRIIPAGLQYPDIARVKIVYGDRSFFPPDYRETPWQQSVDIQVQDRVVGRLVVSYLQEIPRAGGAYFPKEEMQLLGAAADRISHVILYGELNGVYRECREAGEKQSAKTLCEWRVIMDILQKSDQQLFMYLSQKMLHYLCWNGISEAKQLLRQVGSGIAGGVTRKVVGDDINQPIRKNSMDNIININNEIFRIAADNLGEEQILGHIRRWIEEDKSRFLVEVLENPRSSLTELLNAITRFRYLEDEGIKLSSAIEKSLRVSLIRRFLSDQLEFIKIAKSCIEVRDYFDLVRRLIFPAGSHGKLGGKSTGLFLASRIIAKSGKHRELFEKIKIPKTWYMTSDGLMDFLRYNNLENVFEQKYKEMDEIHAEYPNIVQIFKNSHFSPEVIRGLSIAIDDLGDSPIIVRSSSLLEDRLGAAFSGKYKSLFLANQGPKEKRLEALMDAIAEVYASTFSPDPIEYRSERGLLDFDEEMGIMIQQVVGTRVGDYYLPTFAGVAFSNNEFRWSPRIKREDGLIRMVPGLGTRAVDRMADDYPILVAPGEPNLRVNITPDEILRYSPKYIDVIDLKTNTFETISIAELLKQYGHEVPGIQRVVSLVRDNLIQKPTSLLNIDFEKDRAVVTFEGFFQGTDFVPQIAALLEVLEEKIGSPVDIEFAHDGSNLYLLQCRAQSYSHSIQPAAIPRDIRPEKVAFSAKRYISNGYVPDITHVVYVKPEGYNQLSELAQLKSVSRAVGKLNKILPKRQFILMGPGRWGSRGDIKLGVEVTYSDINNTAVLIEIARKTGSYIPELSFGTHFFQDLVEASIRYIPLYPDDDGILFNEEFFNCSTNILVDVLPEYALLSDVIRVIDVPRNTGGSILRILMNAGLDEAVGIFEDPGKKSVEFVDTRETQPRVSEEFWRWRCHMAERLAAHLDPERFGVKGIYVIGSTKNATAGPDSDIDLLVHFVGTKKQRKELMLWLEGWSQTLAEFNYQRTGYQTDGLLDIRLLTDEDIRNKTGFALKIGAVTDPARPLNMKTPDKKKH
jgi:pyruvate,water dikinase